MRTWARGFAVGRLLSVTWDTFPCVLARETTTGVTVTISVYVLKWGYSLDLSLGRFKD